MRANLARRVATFFGVVGILTAVAATLPGPKLPPAFSNLDSAYET